uniref:RabBD domain-containing protein n=1 Tax=Naja naja TaxID=35670 RepID=A0A8C6X995_NAJNA
MNRSSRGIDLSFLNGEEARQILKVLERDSQLKKAEKERLSKCQKKNEDTTGCPGVTGEWLGNFQKKKFKSETDISRMPKQPLAHRLKKGSALDVPQAQKLGSTSILEGLKTPFASLFSSFKKSRKQHLKQPQNSLRLDNQLAKEQSQDTMNTRTPTNYGSTAPEIHHHSTVVGYSTCSLGHSSEDRLAFPSGSYSNGFGPKNFMSKNKMGRSYSLSCLTRRSSLMSADGFSNGTLQHDLENNMDFTKVNFQHHCRRTPLSSIVWNMPQSSRHSVHPNRLRRTQSLIEFNSAFEDRHPCSPEENSSYKFYRSKMNYRQVVPNKTHPLFTERRIDPLCFDSRENYVLHPLKNVSKPCYRYPSFHGKMNLSPNHLPFGRMEEYLFRRNNYQYFSDANHVPDVNFEQLIDRRNDYGKKNDVWQSEHMHDCASEYTKSRDHPGRGTHKLFAKCSKGMQKGSTYVSVALENQTEYAMPNQSHVSGDSQAPSKTFVKPFQTKKNSKMRGTEEMNGADQSDKVDSMDIKKPPLIHAFGQIKTNNPTESQVSPSTVSSQATPPVSVSLHPPFILNSKRQSKANSLRHTENICLSNIHTNNGQRNEDNSTESNHVKQPCPPHLMANPSKLSILQSNPQEEHQLGTWKAFNPDKMLNPVFTEDPKVLPNNDFPLSYAETLHKPNRFVRYSTSNSICGSPSSSPLKSPKTPKTLYQKSASIDGSDLSKKRISPPTRKIPFRNKRMGEDSLEDHVSNRLGNIYSNKGDKRSLFSSSLSSLNISSKEMSEEKNKQIKKYHMHLIQAPNCPSESTNVIGSKRKKRAEMLGPEKAICLSPEKEEAENPLKQYKTTSTLTVSIDEDNVKYHELISVYYTLPQKHSKTLCDVFLGDTKKADSSSSPEKSETPQKQYEVRVGMTTVAFPSSLEKGERLISPNKMPAPDVQQDSKNTGNPVKVLQVSNPTVGTVDISQARCSVNNKKEIAVSGTEELGLAISYRPPVDGPKPGRKEVETVNPNILSSLRVDRHSFPWTETPKLNKSLHLNSLNSKSISLGNISAVSSAINGQKGNPGCSQPSVEASASIPPSNLIDVIQNGKPTAYPEVGTQVNVTEEKIRNAAEIKERARYICRIISERGHRFPPRNEGVRNETSISTTKMHSESQNLTVPGDAALSANAVHPKWNAVECSKPQLQEMPQNPALHKVGTNLQRSERVCVDNGNLNCKDQHSGPTQDLPEHILPESKLALDELKNKVNDLEKRKNRSSVKNKLAAMCRSSRKFSNKKSSSPKPHVSCIFSQNDALPLEKSSHHPLLILPNNSQQTGNENQNQVSLPGEFDIPRLSKVETKKLQADEDRRPLTNLCNQKREHSGQSDKNIKTIQNSSILFSKSIMPVLNNNLQRGSKVLENNNHPIFSKCSGMDAYPPKRGHCKIGELSSFPLLSDKHTYIKNNSKANICPLQKLTSQVERDDYQDNEQSDIFKNVNQSCAKPVLNLSKTQRERHFSESSYTQKLHDSLPPKNNLTQPGYNRKFKSYSELLTCDENENWDTYNENKRNFSSRRIMYPSIEFGIFGKEQQQAFLDNIKRSLTEGRLWNPCLLKNSRSIKREDGYSLRGLEILKSNATEEQFPNEPLDFHEEASAYSSDSDSDTTTDDEYYLHEYEKESEL